MVTEKLDIMKTIKEGVQYGLKNFVPLLLMVILYVLTIWIPYLNVGTTIGVYKAVIGVGRGQVINPLSIFNKEHFENLSKFFLLLTLLVGGMLVAALFMIIPLFVISIAWGFAIYFLIDKKVSPLKALGLSYDATLGNKWRIFFTTLIFSVIVSIVEGILGQIPKVGTVLTVIVSILQGVFMVGIYGVMYDFFSKKADLILAEKGGCCHARAPFDAFEAEEAPAAEEAAEAAPEAEAPAAEPEAPKAEDHSAYMPKADDAAPAETPAE